MVGGDFCQILHVISKDSHTSIVDSCISSSTWKNCKMVTLMQNMRLGEIQEFSQWLLDIGDGKLGTGNDGENDIHIPDDLLVPHCEDAIQAIIKEIYGDWLTCLEDSSFLNDHAILAPTTDIVNKINEYMCHTLPVRLLNI